MTNYDDLIVFLNKQIGVTQIQIDDLTLDVDRMDKDIISQEANITYLNQQKVAINSQMAEKYDEINDYNAIIAILTP